MWIDEIVDNVFEIKKTFCVVKAAKVAHYFDAVFNVLVVSFNGIVIVFDAVSFELDGHTKMEFGDVKKQDVKGVFVILEFIAHKNDELSLFLWLMFLVDVTLQNLRVTCCFHLLEKYHTCMFGSVRDEQMC